MAALLLNPLSTWHVPLGLFSVDDPTPPGELSQAPAELNLDPGAGLTCHHTLYPTHLNFPLSTCCRKAPPAPMWPLQLGWLPGAQL